MGTFLDAVGPGYPPVRLVLVNPFAVALMLEAGKDQKKMFKSKGRIKVVFDSFGQNLKFFFKKGAFENFIKKPIQGFKSVKHFLALPEFC